MRELTPMEMDGLFFGAVFISGLIGASIGRKKMCGGVGYLLGTFMGPLGWIITAVCFDGRPKCPCCMSRIDPGAAMCPMCRHALVTPPPLPWSIPEPPPIRHGLR